MKPSGLTKVRDFVLIQKFRSLFRENDVKDIFLEVRYFLLLLCITTINYGFAQLSLSGKVVEEVSGEPLSYASIIIKAKNSGTSTNVDGFFTLFGIPSDTSSILISYVGYEVLVVTLKEMTSENIILKLKPLSTSLSEVIVSANANKILSATDGTSVARISTKQISTLPSLGEVDIFRSLQLLPGVSGTNENSSGLFVRGGTPAQNLVLLDGMTVYNVNHFYGFFSAFNVNAIKDAQLFKGGYPAKYGGRLSGVVDMTGKTGSFEKIRGNAGINLLSVNGMIELPFGKKFSLLVAGRRSFTDVLQSDMFKKISGNFTDNDQQFRNLDFDELVPEFYYYDWNAKLSFRPSDKDMISLSVYNGKDFLDQSRDLLRKIDFGANIPVRNVTLNITEKTDWGNKAGSLKWSRQWNRRWYSNLLVAGSEYFSDYNIAGTFQLTIPSQDSLVNEITAKGVETNRVQDLSITLDNELLLSKNHKLSFGLAHTITDIKYNAIRDDTVTLLTSDQNTYYSSIYLADKMNFNDDFELTLGLRASYYELTEEFLYSPRVSLNYRAGKNIKLKAAYGLHYQYANRIINETVTEGSREFWILADGDLIDLSSSSQYVLGASYEEDGWLFDIEGYYKDLQGLNEYSLRYRTSEEYVPEELFFKGTGQAQGLEFLLQKKTGAFAGWISYTLSQVVFDFPELNNGNKYYALHDQRHELKVVASYEIENWVLGANYIFGSGKAFSEPEGFYTIEQLNGEYLQYVSVGSKNGSRLPPYSRLDLSVHYKFDIGKTKADLGLSLFNLFNTTNVWYYKYDFQQTPYLKTDVNYLGFTPNISFNVSF